MVKKSKMKVSIWTMLVVDPIAAAILQVLKTSRPNSRPSRPNPSSRRIFTEPTKKMRSLLKLVVSTQRALLVVWMTMTRKAFEGIAVDVLLSLLPSAGN
jgi:hypothetical protein